MAIAYDNSKTFLADSSGTHSTSFTCAVGSSLFAVASQHTTSMTYNGVTMSKIIDFSSPISDGNGQRVVVFWLGTPATGANTLDVTLSGVDPICIVSYTGLDTSLQPEASSTAYSNNGINNTQVTTLANSITTLTDNAWSVMFAAGANSTRTFTAGTGTLRQTSISTILTNVSCIIDSNGPITPPQSSTLASNWSSGSGYISNVVMSIYPPTTPATDTSDFFLVL